MRIVGKKETQTQFTVELNDTEMKVIMAALLHLYSTDGQINGISREQAHYVYESFSLERERINKA